MGQLCNRICGPLDPPKKSSQTPPDLTKTSPKMIPLIHAADQSTRGFNTVPQIYSLDPDKLKNINSVEVGKNHKAAEITFKDFEKLQNLGSGAYGDVILVKKKTNGKQFAMKIIKKSKIVERNMNPQMLVEKNVLLQNKHPFLVRLKYSFQSEKKLYLVMEYCQGGELYTYLVNNKKFSIEVSRFIAAEVLLGLEYLHKNMKIIYRDLKPENIMVLEDGHLKITDFGLAKQFSSENELTSTLRGTPEYIAPEVIKADKVPNHPGYGMKCDIWAFGILLFEIINGSPPFTDKNRNWLGIMNKILQNNPVFSHDFDDDSQDLICKCLKNEPSERPSWDEIKQHPFFSKIDWNLLLKKGIESPLKKLVPRRNGALLQRPRPIYETQDNEVFEQLNGYTYDPQSHIQNDHKF